MPRGGKGDSALQRQERFAISKPPPIFWWTLSILLAFVVAMASIMYWPEPWMRRSDGVLHQLKGQLRSMFRMLEEAWEQLVRSLAPLVRASLLWAAIFAAVFLPLLSLLALFRQRRARSPL